MTKNLDFLGAFNTVLQHLEICNSRNHYDCVVDEGDHIPLAPPGLPEVHSYINEVL